MHRRAVPVPEDLGIAFAARLIGKSLSDSGAGGHGGYQRVVSVIDHGA